MVTGATIASNIPIVRSHFGPQPEMSAGTIERARGWLRVGRRVAAGAIKEERYLGKARRDGRISLFAGAVTRILPIA